VPGDFFLLQATTRFVELLDKLFQMDELGIWWRPHALEIIRELLLPCSVWHIRKVAALIRHGAMAALGTLLRRDLCKEIKSLISLVSVLDVLNWV